MVATTSVGAIIGDLYGIVSTTIELALGIVFLCWVAATYRNLDAFRTTGKLISPGWAVAFYIIPFVNLYRPYKTMVEVWRASAPDVDSSMPSEWAALRRPQLILTWWLLYIFYSLSGLLVFAAYFVTGSTAARQVATVGAVSFMTLLGLAALLAMYKVIVEVDDRQEAKENVMLEADQAARASEMAGPPSET